MKPHRSLALLSLLLSTVATGDDTPVHIPDPNLERAIRDRVHAQNVPLTDDHLHTLVELWVHADTPLDLTGLESAINLRFLFTDDTPLQSLAPLHDHPALEYLNITWNPALDLADLGSPPELATLALSAAPPSTFPTPQQFPALAELCFTSSTLTDLSPALRFSDLVALDISGNQITDLSPLTNLPALNHINASFNRLRTYPTGLAGTLDVRGNFIDPKGILRIHHRTTTTPGPHRSLHTPLFQSFAPEPSIPDPWLAEALRRALGLSRSDTFAPAELGQLSELDLSTSGIADLTGIAALTNLHTLDLSDNVLTDIDALLSLQNLDSLDLSDNFIDLSPESKAFAAITSLHAKGVAIITGEQTDPAAPLVLPDTFIPPASILLNTHRDPLNVTAIDLALSESLQIYTQDAPPEPPAPFPLLENLRPAKRLRALQVSYFSGIIDAGTSQPPSLLRSISLSPLASFPHLEHLLVFGLDTPDLRPLSSCPNLLNLRLHASPDDLAPLASLQRLQALALSLINTPDLTPIASLSNLSELTLWANAPALAPVAALTGLDTISVRSSSIDDIAPLAHLTNLSHIDLTKNLIPDLAPLAGFPRLRTLDATANNLTEIPPFTSPHAYHINLSFNDIADLTPLRSVFPSLVTLDLTHNHITDISPLAGAQKLRTLQLSVNGLTDITPITSLPSLNRFFAHYNPLPSIESGSPLAHKLDQIATPLNVLAQQLIEPRLEPLAPFTPRVAKTGFSHRMTFPVQTGYHYLVERSTDLVSWHPQSYHRHTSPRAERYATLRPDQFIRVRAQPFFLHFESVRQSQNQYWQEHFP